MSIYSVFSTQWDPKQIESEFGTTTLFGAVIKIVCMEHGNTKKYFIFLGGIIDSPMKHNLRIIIM